MDHRERLLTILRRKVPDMVPLDLDWCVFNREALKLFKEKTGYDDPHRYFGIDKNFEQIELRPSKIGLKERYLSFHKNLPQSANIDEWGV